MSLIETEYRDHKIMIRDEVALASDVVAGAVSERPISKRVIEVDGVDVTSRCRVSDTDAEKFEAAKRFVDRVYPKGKSEPKEQPHA